MRRSSLDLMIIYIAALSALFPLSLCSYLISCNVYSYMPALTPGPRLFLFVCPQTTVLLLSWWFSATFLGFRNRSPFQPLTCSPVPVACIICFLSGDIQAPGLAKCISMPPYHCLLRLVEVLRRVLAALFPAALHPWNRAIMQGGVYFPSASPTWCTSQDLSLWTCEGF